MLTFCRNLWGPVLAAVMLAGCVNTRTVAWNDGKQESSEIFGRSVETHSDRALYGQSPSCVVVLAPTSEDGTAAAPMIEEMVARHLSGRIDRVVGPMERQQMARHLALDLADNRDEIPLARESGCTHVVETEVMSTQSVYALVWTREAVGLHLRLRKAGSADILWQARHIATRSDGGLPLSPLSALLSVAEAGMMAGDDDLRPSLTDDALRRIMATLPDFRSGRGTGYSTSALARRYGFN
ncbi:hypothetical protein JCM17960_00390 [Magnetospira thiophila]